MTLELIRLFENYFGISSQYWNYTQTAIFQNAAKLMRDQGLTAQEAFNTIVGKDSNILQHPIESAVIGGLILYFLLKVVK